MAQGVNNQQAWAYAQRDGLLLGIYWILTMGMFICQFAVPLCGTIWLFLMLFTPFYVGGFTAKYGITERESRMTFGSAYIYSYIIYVCGALILSLAFWFYLRYMDDGYLIDKYTSVLTDPHGKEIMEQLGYSEQMIKDVMKLGEQWSSTFRSMRPIDICLELLWFNLVTSIVISVISAFHTLLTLYFRRNRKN